MKKIMKLSVAVAVLMMMLLTSCAGEDETDKDTDPPFPATLIPHLGDTGDPPTDYYNTPQPVVLSEENNGIDAVPDGDWIRLTWLPFIDTDLSHMNIWRYDEYNPEPVLVDTKPTNIEQFLDSNSSLQIGTRYSYYIDLVDFSGNSSTSDTVSYALLSKVILVAPANNTTVTPGNINFTWNRSGFASKFRAMVFDENHNYIWHQDLVVSFEEDPLSISFPVNTAQEYSGRSLFWRIDSFETDDELGIYIGSESYEWIMHIQ